MVTNHPATYNNGRTGRRAKPEIIPIAFNRSAIHCYQFTFLFVGQLCVSLVASRHQR